MTEDVEILRSLRDAIWAKPLLRQIAERRYAPTTGSADGVYRIERFTLRRAYTTETGTRIRSRKGKMNLEVADITQVALRDTRSGGE